MDNSQEPRDPLKLARYYQSLLDSCQFDNRAALARYLHVSRARVTQVLKRLNKVSTSNEFVWDIITDRFLLCVIRVRHPLRAT